MSMFFSIQEVKRGDTGHQGDRLSKTYLFLLLLWMWREVETPAEAHPSAIGLSRHRQSVSTVSVVISVFLDYNVMNDKSQ